MNINRCRIYSVMMSDLNSHVEKVLTAEEQTCLDAQNSRLVPEHKAKLLESNAKKHWDLFYKRNENRFFKDRHWTTREFEELLSDSENSRKILLEIGCGVGNLVFPLLEENRNFFVYACDFSPRAVELVKSNDLYDESRIKAFQADITTRSVFEFVAENSVDVITLIFVLSAIHPDNFAVVVENVYKLLKPGGVLLFRDYGLHDMAQIRFKPGHKIADNFYMRLDGTRCFMTHRIVQYASRNCLCKGFQYSLKRRCGRFYDTYLRRPL